MSKRRKLKNKNKKMRENIETNINLIRSHFEVLQNTMGLLISTDISKSFSCNMCRKKTGYDIPMFIGLYDMGVVLHCPRCLFNEAIADYNEDKMKKYLDSLGKDIKKKDR